MPKAEAGGISGEVITPVTAVVAATTAVAAVAVAEATTESVELARLRPKSQSGRRCASASERVDRGARQSRRVVRGSQWRPREPPQELLRETVVYGLWRLFSSGSLGRLVRSREDRGLSCFRLEWRTGRQSCPEERALLLCLRHGSLQKQTRNKNGEKLSYAKTTRKTVRENRAFTYGTWTPRNGTVPGGIVSCDGQEYATPLICGGQHVHRIFLAFPDCRKVPPSLLVRLIAYIPKNSFVVSLRLCRSFNRTRDMTIRKKFIVNMLVVVPSS